MLSRIFWVGLAVVALIAGAAVHERDWFFSWPGDGAGERSAEAGIEAQIDRAIDRSIDRMEVVTVNGRAVRVSRAQKDAMADAIGRLAKAEGQLVAFQIRGASNGEIEEARAAREQARAEVERMESQMAAEGEAQRSARDAIRTQVRSEIRGTIRDAVR